MTPSHVFHIPCERAAISEFADRFGEWCDAAELDVRTTMAFQVALDEILTNIVDYGFPEGGGSPIEVRAARIDDTVHVDVIDHGLSFDPFAREVPDTDLPLEEREIGGLGIHLVRELMDEVHWRRENGANLLQLYKRLPTVV